MKMKEWGGEYKEVEVTSGCREGIYLIYSIIPIWELARLMGERLINV